MRFSILAIAATLVSTAFAQITAISVPGGSTIWVLGTNATARWTAGLIADTDVELLTGAFVTTQHVAGSLGTALKGKSDFTGLVPKNLQPGWYTVRIGTVYSHLFAIQKDAKTPLTISQPALPATSTVALPTTTSAFVPTASGTSTSTSLPTSTNKPSAASGSLKAGNILPLAAAAVLAVLAL